jgi:hypothetical protein
MKAYLIPVVMLITACGKGEIAEDWNKRHQKDNDTVYQEEPAPALRAILDSFISDCRDTYHADVSLANKLEYIRYGDPATKEKPYVVGQCNMMYYEDGSLAKSNIIVKEMNNPIMAKALLYHELGHCILDLDHTSEESQTLMSPNMFSSKYYTNNWDRLVKDLCHKYLK